MPPIFFVDTYKLILKCIWKGTGRAKIIQTKNKIGAVALPNIKA